MGSYPYTLLSLLLKSQPSSKKWTGNLHTRYSEYIDCSKMWSFNSQLADIPLGGAKYIKKAQLLEVLVEVWVEGVWGGEGIRKNWTNDPGSVRKSLHRNSVPEQCF